MKKRTRILTLLLSLNLFLMTGMSVAATEKEGEEADGTTQVTTEETQDPDVNPTPEKTEETDKTQEKYPAGTGAIQEKDSYCYTIRIFAGAQGTFTDKVQEDTGNREEGQEPETVTPAETGTTPEGGDGTETGGDTEPVEGEEPEKPGVEMVSFTLDPKDYDGDIQLILDWQNFVKLNDNSKYYVKGIRESGRDNSTVGAITVTGDRDFVVAYGLRGQMVNYTVEFVDQAGNTLAPSQTYEGKVGDKPVVAYLYIDGYRPQAYNLTKTLVEDAEKNVFRFVYGQATTPPGRVTGSDGEVIIIIDNGITDLGGGGTIGNDDVIDDGTTVIGGGGGAGAGAGADGADGAEGGIEIEDEPTPLGAPEELIDLDDEEVPLAGNGLFGGVEGNANPFGVPVIIIALIAMVIAAGLWYMFIFRKKKQKETES